MTQHWSTCQLGKTVLVSHRTKIMARLRQKIYPMGSMSFYMVLGQKMWQTGGQKNWYMDVHAFKTRYFIGVHTSPYQEPWWDPGKQWVRATPARSENKRILLQQTLRYHFAEWKTQHRTNRCRNGTIKKRGRAPVLTIQVTRTAWVYLACRAWCRSRIHTHTPIHIHMHMHIHIHIHIIHMMYIYMYIYIYKYKYIYIYICMCMCIYKSIYIYLHRHMHANAIRIYV